MFKFLLVIFSIISFPSNVYASGPMEDEPIQIQNIQRKENLTKEEHRRISIAAGLLADYEISAKKLINSVKQVETKASQINEQARNLLNISEKAIDNMHFRLPQCKEYLEKTLVLKEQLQTISHETLEKDYHHDGALPKAPVECYHTKDLFVHPATVIVLTRDDSTLNKKTRSSIEAEIAEVLGHTEVVRQLVIY